MSLEPLVDELNITSFRHGEVFHWGANRKNTPPILS